MPYRPLLISKMGLTWLNGRVEKNTEHIRIKVAHAAGMALI